MSIVRSCQLEAALSDFVTQAAVRLHADVQAGQEVPFELDSHSGRGRSASLYCYRPLTGTFIAERLPELRRLPGYGQAAGLLERFESLDRYLISAGEDPARRGGRTRGDMALVALLRDVFDEQTDFELRSERLDAALERLDGAALGATGEVMLVATLHGLTISSPELALTRGLVIAQPGAWRGVPSQASGDGEAEHLLAIFTAEDRDPSTAVAQGRTVMHELLRALRLFGDGRVTLGSLAWTRIGSGAWEALALGRGGRPHGMLVVCAEQEDELRAFCNLVSRRVPHDDETAWALRRFELGCDRGRYYDAISDHLMALRALLEPEGPASGLLAGRLAALCATPDGRMATSERVLAACALEREVIAGRVPERAAGVNLARELSDHLRALLRDVICGHLPNDLVSLADELLLAEDPAGDAAGTARDADRAPAPSSPRATPSPRHGGSPDSSGGQDRLPLEEALGDRGEPAEILHVTV